MVYLRYTGRRRTIGEIAVYVCDHIYEAHTNKYRSVRVDTCALLPLHRQLEQFI